MITNLENFNISQDMIDLLRWMLEKNPSRRLSSYELLNKFHVRFSLQAKSIKNLGVKYTSAKTYSRIDINDGYAENEVQQPKYGTERGLQKINKKR